MSSERSSASRALVLPMQEPGGGDGALSSVGGTPRQPSPSVGSAGDLQRSLARQQLAQAQREARQLRAELAEAGQRLAQATARLNEAKTEQSALSHRYGGTVEKLTAAEADAKRLEGQLVQERARLHQLREERDAARAAAREGQWQVERLQAAVAQLEASRGLDEREVQRRLEDRTQYVPAVEARRAAAEAAAERQALADRLAASVDALRGAGEEAATTHFVSRSAVQSAAAELESRLLRAEAALDRAHRQLLSHQDTTARETEDFMAALLGENRELWQRLAQLQGEHEAAQAELARARQRGEVVPLDEHRYVQRQLEATAERLAKAQQLVAAQTALARESEAELQRLMDENAELQEQHDALAAAHKEERATTAQQAAALQEADRALADATARITALTAEAAAERQSHAAAVARLEASGQALGAEHEQHARQLTRDRDDALRRLAETEAALEEEREARAAAEDAAAVERRQAAAQQERAEAAARRQQEEAADALGELRAVLEGEVAGLRAELEEAQAAARQAQRERDDAAAEAQAAAAAGKGLEAALADERRQQEELRAQAAEAAERARAAAAELERLREAAGEEGTHSRGLAQQVERLTRERDAAAARLEEEQARAAQRHQLLQRDWQASEAARASLQEEVKALRARAAEAEAARRQEERAGVDRATLMRENERLQAQYAQLQREAAAASDALAALRARGGGGEQLRAELEETQRRLAELPALRRGAEEARREALKAREETEALRRERDAMAAKLDYFLEESKAASKLDADFDRMLREANETVRRLGGQVGAAKGRRGNANTASHTGAEGLATPLTHGGRASASASATSPRPWK